MGADDTPPMEIPAHSDHKPSVDVLYVLEAVKRDLQRDIREFRKAQSDALGAVFSRLSGIETRMSDESLVRQKHDLQIAELAAASKDVDERLAFLESCEAERAKAEYAAKEVMRVNQAEVSNSILRVLPGDMLRIVAGSIAAGLCALAWWAIVTYIRAHPGG
jgi:hypothetical protein